MPNFLLVIIPVAALLIAALNILRKQNSAQLVGGRSGGSDHSSARAPRGGSPDATTDGRETHGSFRSSGTRRRHENSSPTASASADSDSVHREQCQLCCADRDLIELYPCNHNNICIRCALECMKFRKDCPFCHSRIDGFASGGNQQ